MNQKSGAKRINVRIRRTRSIGGGSFDTPLIIFTPLQTDRVLGFFRDNFSERWRRGRNKKKVAERARAAECRNV